MKDKLDNIKVLVLDVDDTGLVLKMYKDENGKNNKDGGKRIIGIFDCDEWLEYNIMNNAYKYCVAPVPLANLAQYVKNNGGLVMGLTECRNSFEYNAKYNRMRECYEGCFEHHGDLVTVDTRKLKVKVMLKLCNKYGITPDQMMFIDNSSSEVMEASESGIFAMHTTEALLRFDSMDETHINGIDVECEQTHNEQSVCYSSKSRQQ
jgi:hypothetical protein